MDVVLFYLFGAVTVGASLAVIGQRSPLRSVLWLIASFLGLSGLYVLLDSPFTAVTQIIVYAGAIMVLFLFVVMLVNRPREEALADHARNGLLAKGPRRSAAALAVAFLALVGWALARWVFEFEWTATPLVPLLGAAAGALLALAAGWWGLRDVLRRPVVDTLRRAAE